MARAFDLGLISVAIAVAAPAWAGSAPVAYYPSLGYGQTPPPASAPPAPADAPPGRYERQTFRHVERAASGYGERLPDSLFADAGGVGQDEFAWGGSGGYVVGGASGGAYASAAAYAGASAQVGIRLGRHGGGHGGGHVSGCGCKR